MLATTPPGSPATTFSATAPVAPRPGQKWCDTATSFEYTWTGTEWADLSSVPIGTVALWRRSDAANIPAGWVECSGAHFTSDEADIGAMLVMIKHAGQVATPTITPAAGTYAGTQSVTCACPTSGATMKYTTDGSTPSRSNGTTYSGAFNVAATATVKAVAYKDLWLDSTVASAAYTITTTPTVTARSINAAGTQLTIATSQAVSVGAGGNGGLALTSSGAAVTATYASGAGTTALVYTLSRTVLSSETLTLAYTQPGNGLEATSGGADVASFSGAAVTNNSTQTGGGAASPYITAIGTAGTFYDLTGDRGGKFTVGGAGVTITELGLYKYSGRYMAGAITVKLKNAGGTVLGSVSVTPADNAFAYATLSSPISLAAGAVFFVEAALGYDSVQLAIGVTPASGITCNGATDNTSEQGWGANILSGPVNFKFY